jgi:hypothetical protein
MITISQELPCHLLKGQQLLADGTPTGVETYGVANQMAAVVAQDKTLNVLQLASLEIQVLKLATNHQSQAKLALLPLQTLAHQPLKQAVLPHKITIIQERPCHRLEVLTMLRLNLKSVAKP